MTFYIPPADHPDAEICRLHREGLSLSEIALALDIHYRDAQNRLAYWGYMRVSHMWTYEDEAKALEMLSAGASFAEVGEAVGRAANAVRTRAIEKRWPRPIVPYWRTNAAPHPSEVPMRASIARQQRYRRAWPVGDAVCATGSLEGAAERLGLTLEETRKRWSDYQSIMHPWGVSLDSTYQP